MPIKAYYGGHGRKVMAAMRKTYGKKKGTSVFYATANKTGQAPKRRRKKK